MRFLGIDYGEKRIGLAISDEGAKLAFPKKVIANSKETFAELEKIISEESVGEIVIGESVDSRGKPNAISASIEDFIKELEDRFSAKGGPASGGNLPVHKQKEFFTSVEARRYNDSGQNAVDASAAALILQRYLDKRNK